jgi:sulfate transport system ATP-binding protein
VTTVLVTHDQEEAMEVSDRIAVMHEGRIEQVGSPSEVYDKPVNDFVMGFLGPAVRLDGHLVRPHDLTISHQRNNGDIEAVITRIVHLGFEVRVEMELPDGSQARAQLTRAQAGELDLGTGDTVYVKAPATAREKAVA